MFRFNIVEKIENINLFFFKKNKSSVVDGNGGNIFIAARNMTGDGEINADGGETQGKAGNITIITENNSFTSKVSAKGKS